MAVETAGRGLWVIWLLGLQKSIYYLLNLLFRIGANNKENSNPNNHNNHHALGILFKRALQYRISGEAHYRQKVELCLSPIVG